MLLLFLHQIRCTNLLRGFMFRLLVYCKSCMTGIDSWDFLYESSRSVGAWRNVFFWFTSLGLLQITNLLAMDSICVLKGRDLGLKRGQVKHPSPSIGEASPVHKGGRSMMPQASVPHTALQLNFGTNFYCLSNIYIYILLIFMLIKH